MKRKIINLFLIFSPILFGFIPDKDSNSTHSVAKCPAIINIYNQVPSSTICKITRCTYYNNSCENVSVVLNLLNNQNGSLGAQCIGDDEVTLKISGVFNYVAFYDVNGNEKHRLDYTGINNSIYTFGLNADDFGNCGYSEIIVW